MGPWLSSPLPTSPTRGEVPLPVLGTILPNPPAHHLPLDGGGREGVGQQAPGLRLP